MEGKLHRLKIDHSLSSFLDNLFFFNHNLIMKKFFVSPFGFVFAIVLFILCSFWIYKNVKLEDLVGNSVNSNFKNPLRSLGKGESNQKDRKFEIRNNDIVEVISPESVKLIVDGKKIEGMESISDLSVSSDGKYFCFLVHKMVPIWLYVSDVDGKVVKEVDLAKNCVWSPDSRYVAYNNHTTDVSPVNVYIYSLTNGKSTNLTEGYEKEGYFRNYTDIKWISNEEIKSTFTSFDKNDVSKSFSGSSLININGKVTDE